MHCALELGCHLLTHLCLFCHQRYVICKVQVCETVLLMPDDTVLRNILLQYKNENATDHTVEAVIDNAYNEIADILFLSAKDYVPERRKFFFINSGGTKNSIS